MSEQDLSFTPVSGIRLASTGAGIKYADRDDLVLVGLSDSTQTAAVFTRNAFCAAPVTLSKAHLTANRARFLLINSGNANAGTGKPGMQAAIDCCRAVADAAQCAPEAVLPFSTGVIGEPLPVERIAAAVPGLVGQLSEDGWSRAARAIMTTDTVPKLISRQIMIDGVEYAITGMAKGAGMIKPDMATMLAYIATDANVPVGLLQDMLQVAVAGSFNAISVDGDTSTNDACVLMATGAAGGPELLAGSEAAGQFQQVLDELCLALATELVRDAEGATKLVSVEVSEAADQADARQVAYTIAHSPLVKTALFASDPNWGRILAAVGRAGLERLDIDRVRIYLDDVCIVRDGGRAPDYTEAAGQAVMDKHELTIRVVLGQGQASARVLTCDLSYDYVRINAEYRT